MKIKLGKIHKDPTAYGNKYYIKIEDTRLCDNEDLEKLVNKQVTVIIGDPKALDNVIAEHTEEYL